MTRVSLPTIHQCPACDGYLRRHTFVSFYMDGLTRWSDGCTSGIWNYMHGPLAKCPHCSTLFWWNDTAEVMRLDPPRPMGWLTRTFLALTGDRDGRLRELREWAALPAALKDAEGADAPDYDDMRQAVTQLHVSRPEREIFLRRRMWWESNNHLRDPETPSPVSTLPSEIAQANMRRLLELVEDDPTEQVTRGELLRQLGRFDEAVAVLKAVTPNGYSEVQAVKIQRFAEQRIAQLQVIETGTR